MSDAKAGRRAERRQQRRGDTPGDERRQPEIALEEEGEQGADHGGADETKLAQHVAIGNARTAGLALGKPLAQHHQAVEHHRDEEQRYLYLPGDGLARDAPGHEVAGQAAEDQSPRPAGMQDVEIMCLVLREQGRDERIHDRLGDAVADGEEKHAPEEALEGERLAAGGEGGAGREREPG